MKISAEITSISQVYLDLLICGKLNGYMTNTSQSRNKTTVHSKKPWLDIIENPLKCIKSKKKYNQPVQATYTLFMSNSSQSRYCSLIWHHAASHSLGLHLEKIQGAKINDSSCNSQTGNMSNFSVEDISIYQVS